MKELLIGLTLLASLSTFAKDEINLTKGGSVSISGIDVTCMETSKKIFKASGGSFYKSDCSNYMGQGFDTNSMILESLLQSRTEALRKAKRKCETEGYQHCYIISNEIESRTSKEGSTVCGAFATVIGIK